ncbi:hypothetical protein MKZ38_006368 [Zalerion maritima]|uniref:Apurinic-apyrimidinic endonuclease 1 n=1 Tax=Zalerion maritima TaxID=339359 RepID=A0AAD5RVK3_9PEZI|nr:hypothetical protein MKZ38_006368 [Zalerion maritima]
MPPKRKSTISASTSKEAPATKKTKTTTSKASKPSSTHEMPLASRTPITSLARPMYIGAHISAAGGVQNSIPNAMHIGSNAFALFLKSQRKWTSPPLDPSARDAFHENMKAHSYSYDHILPHGSYLVNLAQADPTKAEQAYANFVDDLKRCESLGIKLYNFHPGYTGGAPRPEALSRIASQLNRAHAATSSVVTVIENMAGHGNVVGGSFADMATIISRVDDKSRVGVCIDTCHAFAAGYDLRTPSSFREVMDEFSSEVGLGYLRALHLNDSKAPLGAGRDVHANIGAGFLGLRAFHSVVNFAGFENLPMVLETPIDRTNPASGKTEEDKQVWADEIKLLEKLVGMDAESEEFKSLEEDLSSKGEKEREKFQDQVDRKKEKDARKAGGTGKKGTTGKQTKLAGMAAAAGESKEKKKAPAKKAAPPARKKAAPAPKAKKRGKRRRSDDDTSNEEDE